MFLPISTTDLTENDVTIVHHHNHRLLKNLLYDFIYFSFNTRLLTRTT